MLEGGVGSRLAAGCGNQVVHVVHLLQAVSEWKQVVEVLSVTLCFLLRQWTLNVSEYDGHCDCLWADECLEARDGGFGDSGKKVPE